MNGDVMGKPVAHRLAVRPALNGTFTELHMIDVEQPPQYSAPAARCRTASGG